MGFHVEVERVACGASDVFEPTTVEATVNLIDMLLPKGFAVIEHKWGSTSDLIASDLFVTLEAGCYDIAAHPASAITDASWVPSSDCHPAYLDNLTVVNGQTTEGVLISQCNPS